jgi:hypothetical protein
VDESSNPYICFADLGNSDLKFAYKDPWPWIVETVDSEGSVGWRPSIVMDEEGVVHLSYQDYTNGALKVAHRTASGWQTEVVDDNGDVGWDSSITSDQTGLLRVTHRNLTNGTLNYAYETASGWAFEVIDSSGSPGRYASLRIDGNNRPHISHNTIGSENLKYAFFDGTEWQLQTVDSQGVVGRDASLALNALGYPHISYYDLDNKALKYAHDEGFGWWIETVDGDGDVGWDTSIELDSLGVPHVSYYDYWNNDLKYAVRYSPGWEIEVAASSGANGRFTSVALDSNLYPHMSHYDDVNGDVLHTFKDENGWHTEMVDGSGDVGNDGTSIALDSLGHAHIAYCEQSSDIYPEYLKYAFWDGVEWQIDVIDGPEIRPRDPTLVLDPAGFPHIGYRDHSNRQAKHAYEDATGWHIEVISEFAGIGRVSIALDRNGIPRVAFRDADRDLVYAYWDPSGVKDKPEELPVDRAVRIVGVYPNPIHTFGQLVYRVGQGTIPGRRHVTIAVYDLHGRLIARPVNCLLAQGEYRAPLDLRTPGGMKAPPGTYVVQIKTDNPPRSDSSRLVRFR